jgi:hypothetical protein
VSKVDKRLRLKKKSRLHGRIWRVISNSLGILRHAKENL